MPFSATRNHVSGIGLGAVVSPCSGSIRLDDTWVAITEVVPITSPQCAASIAPVPTAVVTESIVAPITIAPGETPRCAAASGVMGPRGCPSGTSGGSLAGSRPDMASNSSEYSVRFQSRLSTASIGNIVFWVAVTLPVSRPAT